MLSVFRLSSFVFPLPSSFSPFPVPDSSLFTFNHSLSKGSPSMDLRQGKAHNRPAHAGT